MKKLTVLIITLITLFLLSGVADAATFKYASSPKGEITLYMTPSDDGFVITKIPACSELELIKTERTWGLVSFRNKVGWVNLSFTRESYLEAAETTGSDMESSVQVSTKSGQATLYTLPSEDPASGSEAKYQVPNETVLEIKRQISSTWGLVSMNGEYAWIKMSEVKPFDTHNESEIYGIYYVYTLSEKGEGVNLFVNEYGQNLCAVIPDCVKLTVQETLNGYGHVAYDGIDGWINLDDTTQSLLNAQANAGEKVNKECTVKEPEEGNTVSVYSVPSKNPADGAGVIGTVKKGESVYVLRATQNGWSLINCDGQLGWLPPQSVEEEHPDNKYDNLKIFTFQGFSYIATKQSRGLKVYAEPGSAREVSFVPETARIKVLAEKDGYKYVYSDFAAGWVKEVPSFKTREETLSLYHSKKTKTYITQKDTSLMSVPTLDEFGENKILMTVPKGKRIEVKRVVTSGKTKWLLVEVDGKSGWINKADAQQEGFVIMLCLTIIAGLLAIGAVLVIILRTLKKKRKKNEEKEVEEIEESVHNEDSGTYEESPTLSGK